MDKQHLDTIRAYVAAWNEPSEDKIKQAVAHCVEPDVSYCDPFTDPAKGIEALVKVMTNVSQSFPGVTHELTGEPVVHHNFGYYQWSARMNDKTIPGVDYIEFAPTGRIIRVVSFTNTADWQQ